MGKNVVTAEQLREAQRLKSIWNAKKKSLNLTQEKLGIALGGSGQSTASNYLNGITALNLRCALIFAQELNVSVEDFSPSLAKLITGNQNVQKSEVLERISQKIDDFSASEMREVEAQIELIRRRKIGDF